MLRAISLTMCLLLPVTALAQDPVVAPAADAPAADPSLTPSEVPAPNPATEGTRSCGMRHGCGHPGGAVKFFVITGVVGAVLTGVGVAIAVGVANSNAPGQVAR